MDGLRAVAIASVMGFHFVRPVVSGGSLGVDVFFVLSGWLITSILVREFKAAGRIDYGGFIGRRARRLLPALFVLLAAYVLLAPSLFSHHAPGRWTDAAAAAFYVTNLRETFWPTDNPLSHTWSLAIEEQFYLLWPFALLALLRLERRTAAILLCVAWAVLTVARVASNELWPSPAAYYFTPFHATGLLLGSALALYPLKVNGFAGRISLALLVAFFIAGHTDRYFLALQPVAEIAAALAIARPPNILAREPLPFLGRISYGVYLWHVPLMYALPPRGWLSLAELIGASILAGWMSHVLVERWFLARRRPARALSQASA
ncbi:MAG TPA: acyltransferase [Caulobacteraceae bacterium]|nr:acyltransferase [Caulobacteraceae bacterium]